MNEMRIDEKEMEKQDNADFEVNADEASGGSGGYPDDQQEKRLQPSEEKGIPMDQGRPFRLPDLEEKF